jgi:hypothetical protein
MSIKQKIHFNLKNSIGKSLKQKYIIFESDDWGSIRMPSIETLNILKSKGISLDKADNKRYTHNDTLASSDDLELLFGVLSKHKDSVGNSPIFTALSVVANPNFKKIEESNFKSYFCEPFTVTLKNYGHHKAFDLWKEGMNKNLFYPEFHGREHLNVPVWMRALKAQDKDTMLAFENKLWAIKSEFTKNIFYEAAFDVEHQTDINEHKLILEEGLKMFKQIHGYKARVIVPPNGSFNRALEEICFNNGIKFIGASKVQKEPLGNNKHKKVFHWFGQKNKFNQIYLTRNAFFEPNKPSNSEDINSCLKNIHYAFKWKKPAVISTHRTNYCGTLNIKNRDKSLKQLDELLSKIVELWPDVKFITSSQLGEIVSK